MIISKAFKAYRLAALKASYTFWTLVVKAVMKANGVKYAGVRAVGYPYINVSLGSKVTIGDNFLIRTGLCGADVGSVGSRIIVGKNSVLKIGRNVGMSNVTVFVQQSVEIGDDVMIGGGVQIFDTNFHPLDPRVRTVCHGPCDSVAKMPVVIGSRVFIGVNAIICKGVRIGDDSVVAAGAVVVKDIPSGEIWGGNPARFIKKVIKEETP